MKSVFNLERYKEVVDSQTEISVVEEIGKNTQLIYKLINKADNVGLTDIKDIRLLIKTIKFFGDLEKEYILKRRELGNVKSIR